MKRKITLSIALALSVVALLLASSDSTTQAQQRRVFRADTGIITLGPNQMLRLTVVSGDFNPDNDVSVRFRRMGYVEADNVYKLAAQDVTAPVTLNADEAAYIDVQGDGNGVRVMAEWSSGRDVRVIAQITDADTGRVVAISVPNDSSKLD